MTSLNPTGSLINVLPAYLQKDYFNGEHAGYTYSATLNDYSYSITAAPVSESTGTKTFTLVTGSIVSEE